MLVVFDGAAVSFGLPTLSRRRSRRCSAIEKEEGASMNMRDTTYCSHWCLTARTNPLSAFSAHAVFEPPSFDVDCAVARFHPSLLKPVSPHCATVLRD